jgi:hypothetical protein
MVGATLPFKLEYNMANINIHGKYKEVKWVEVNNETNTVSIYFTDFTFVRMEDVNIKEVE